jgi:hypothetical protein
VGDLVSEEDRYLVLLTEVLPLPLLPDGTLPASLEGEELLGLEFAWTEISDTEIKGCTSAHLVRIRGTQDAADVVLNQEVIAVIANQIAGKAMREAADQARRATLMTACDRLTLPARPSRALQQPNLRPKRANFWTKAAKRSLRENCLPAT